MIRPALFALLLTLSSATASVTVTGATDANESPLVDAGLDQTVERGTMVILDGLGSRDPDGQIVSIRWTITTPDGGTITPDNETAPRTRFRPRERGRYEVTLAATDDGGTTQSDTLYVTVTPGAAPRVSLTGPGRVQVGNTTQFEATLSRGAAPLAEVAWRVDGTLIETTPLRPNQSAASIDATFGMPGDHRVIATLRDADGLTATAVTITTAVRPRMRNLSGDSPAPDYSPTVRGPQLVTGAQPLDARYSIRTGGDVRSVEWFDDRGSFATGRTVRRAWSPGRHTLFAVVTYRQDSRIVARFSDGTTSVVADPQPSVSFQDITGKDVIAGSALGSDAYGNLRNVRVQVAERTVARWPDVDVGSIGRTVDKHAVTFRTTDFDFGERYQVTAIATDSRGQQVRVNRDVEYVGTPEVVQSAFVNSPVDSFDERINASRYAAHHVLKLDLNGKDPEMISIKYGLLDSDIVRLREHRRTNRTYSQMSDILELHTYWAGEIPGKYEINWKISDGESVTSSEEGYSLFRVTSSEPVIRMKVIHDGTPHMKTDWGITVDASDSFDPDDSSLRYFWKRGAEPISQDNTIAKFDSFDRATLVLEDEYGNEAIRAARFHSFYVPAINITPIFDGPYLPNETVSFRIRTEEYALSKVNYEIDLGINTGDDDIVVHNWHREIERHGQEQDREWTGRITVPASKFLDGEPLTVTVYNEKQPKITAAEIAVPDQSVFVPGKPVRGNLSVSDVRYQIRTDVHASVTTQSESDKDAYLAEGYQVVDVSSHGIEYTLERYEKVSDAVYGTETKSFRTTGYRSVFLRENPSWSAAGSKRETREWTTTETIWRNSHGGRGTFTGHTRRVQTEPPQYRTERQYQREYRYNGRTYTETYWASSRYHPGDSYTGRSRRVKVSDAEFETQYKYEYEVQHQSTTRYYLADRQVKVQSADYDWQIATVTINEGQAQKLLSRDNYRVHATKSTHKWTLSKFLGTTTDIRSSYEEPQQVRETRATVSGTLTERFFNPDTGEWQNTSSIPFTLDYSTEGLATMTEIKYEVRHTGLEAECDSRPVINRCQEVQNGEQ